MVSKGARLATCVTLLGILLLNLLEQEMRFRLFVSICAVLEAVLLNFLRWAVQGISKLLLGHCIPVNTQCCLWLPQGLWGRSGEDLWFTAAHSWDRGLYIQKSKPAWDSHLFIYKSPNTHATRTDWQGSVSSLTVSPYFGSYVDPGKGLLVVAVTWFHILQPDLQNFCCCLRFFFNRLIKQQ